MSYFNREVLKKALINNMVHVTFNKVDGTQREMLCTLMEDVVPPAKTDPTARKVNDAVLNVWDLDKRDWRSFRVENVTGYEIV